jgi:hypothetical protein
MNKHIKQNLGKIITALTLIGFTAGMALADQQAIPFTPQNSGTGSGCPGIWTGYAKMTNATDGTLWIIPPTNAISGTLTDASGFAAPYESVAYVTRKSNSQHWCNTNSVTFPVTNTTKYAFTVYVKTPLPPPTNGQPMNLQITWQTQ